MSNNTGKCKNCKATNIPLLCENYCFGCHCIYTTEELEYKAYYKEFNEKILKKELNNE